jgi:hypothetical protein
VRKPAPAPRDLEPTEEQTPADATRQRVQLVLPSKLRYHFSEKEDLCLNARHAERVAEGLPRFCGNCGYQFASGPTVNRAPQIPAHLHSRDGPPGEIIKCQNSDGRIAEERLGKAHLKGGSEVADAESPGSVVEAMDRRLAAGRAEPKRIPGLRVNSHPAGSGSDTT